MRFIRLLLILLLTIASPIASVSGEIDWSKYDLPDLGKDEMWCMFTSYVPINEQEQIYMCSYECENGMVLNTPGKGSCPRDVKERRW